MYSGLFLTIYVSTYLLPCHTLPRPLTLLTIIFENELKYALRNDPQFSYCFHKKAILGNCLMKVSYTPLLSRNSCVIFKRVCVFFPRPPPPLTPQSIICIEDSHPPLPSSSSVLYCNSTHHQYGQDRAHSIEGVFIQKIKQRSSLLLQGTELLQFLAALAI